MDSLTLWYVRDHEGDQDLLVRCNTASEALLHWRLHFERGDDAPTYIGPVPLDRIGPVDWGRIADSAFTRHYKPLPE